MRLISCLPRRPIISAHKLSQRSMRNVSPGMKTATRRRRMWSVHECITSGGNRTTSTAGTALSQTFFTPKPPILALHHVQQRQRTQPCYLHPCPIGGQGKLQWTWVTCYWGGFLLFGLCILFVFFYLLFNVLTHVLVLTRYGCVSKVCCIYEHMAIW